MATFKTQAPVAEPQKLDSKTLSAFLAKLAETSNVSASAKAVGVSSARIYGHRRSSPAFQARWMKALAEGYARLEGDLLAEALRPAGSTISEKTLKSRAQKQRLGLTLLAAHRASVRGEVSAPPPAEGSKTKAEAQARLVARFDLIRERLSAAGDA